LPPVPFAVTATCVSPFELVVVEVDDGVPDGEFAPDELVLDGGVQFTVAPESAVLVPVGDVQVAFATNGLANVVLTGVAWPFPDTTLRLGISGRPLLGDSGQSPGGGFTMTVATAVTGLTGFSPAFGYPLAVAVSVTL
jgi:hypothetical protein